MNRPELHLTLGIEPTEVRHARDAVRHLMTEHAIDDDGQEVAQLLVAELVTNALLHGGPPIELRGELNDDGSVLHVEVHDGSEEQPRLREPGRGGSGGYGLHLVQAMARAWGVRPAEDGKDVWFDVGVRKVWPLPSRG